MVETKARRLRELLRNNRPVVSPGVYDGYSARLVETMGFKTAATTGAGLTNSVIVQPDIGIFGLRDNVDACRHLARSVSIPLTADADTGYGNAVTVYHVVQYFEGQVVEQTLVTGEGGQPGQITFAMHGWAEVRLIANGEAGAVSSSTAVVSGYAGNVGYPQLQRGLYCSDEANCTALVQSSACDGKLSWNVVFVRRY